MKIQITHDVDKLVAKLKGMQAATPKVIARAVNNTAVKVQDRLTHEIGAAFDRPNPLTKKSVRVKFGTPELPIATVFLIDKLARGTPPAQYLLPQITGGSRRFKKLEEALDSIGAMPSRSYVVPGSAVKLDAYGNVAKSQLKAIFSALKGQKGEGLAAKKRTKARNKRARIFASPRGPHQGWTPGIWQATAKGIQPILVFKTSSPSYLRRFRFGAVALNEIQKSFGPEFERAWTEAMSGKKK